MCQHCRNTGRNDNMAPCIHCKRGAKIIVGRLFEEQKRIKALLNTKEGDEKKKYEVLLTENTRAIERTRRKWHV